MATLDITDIMVVGFPVETTVTAPDGNTFIVAAGVWLGVSSLYEGTMTVSPAGKVLCMVGGNTVVNREGGNLVQVMTVDEIRTSV